MRTDVKIGLAAVGVLLAAVVVLVISGGNNNQPGAELITGYEGSPIDAVDVAARPAPSAPPAVERPAPPAEEIAEDPGLDPFRDPPVRSSRDSRESAGTFLNGDTTHQNDVNWAKILETGQLTPFVSETPSVLVSSRPPPQENAAQHQDRSEAEAGSATPQRIPLEVPEDFLADSDGPATQIVASRPAAEAGAGAAPASPASSGPRNSGQERTHTVGEGETLSAISSRLYGSANFWPHIARANPDINPDRLRPGTRLIIPVIEHAPAAQAARPASIDPSREYRVQHGDSLYSISQKLYGRGDRVDDLYELNKGAIGPDPARLKLDMLLRLPDPPSATASVQ